MNGSRVRLDRVACAAWVVSGLLHVSFLWLLLLILLPGGLPQEMLDLEIAVTRPGAELVILDVTVSEPEPDDDARLLDVIGDMSAAPLPIPSPASTLASGTGDNGRHQSTAGTQVAATGGAGRATFFGTQAEGDRFVYVLDTSGSMNAGNGRRLKRAVAELLRSVDQLAEYQQFYVLLFAATTRRMFDAKDGFSRMVPATTANKVRLRRWVQSLRPSGGTHPQEALQIGLDMRPSAIFMLSDGRFSRPHGSRRFLVGRKREVREVVALKDPGTVPIHTVAFEEPRAKENLREISKMTSGQFTYVPEPDVFASSEVRERMAAHWMAVANKLEKESRPDMAQRYYEKILDHFTGSEVASEAERRRQEYLVMSPKDR